MKNILSILILAIGLFSCKPINSKVAAGTETYPKEFQFLQGRATTLNNWYIILGSDGHEYLENDGTNSYVCMHYVDCKLCMSRLTSHDQIAFPPK